MKYEEVAAKIRELSCELFNVGLEADCFENCRIMHIAGETLKAMSDSLDAIADGLTDE